jgi:hypothetical protein
MASEEEVDFRPKPLGWRVIVLVVVLLGLGYPAVHASLNSILLPRAYIEAAVILLLAGLGLFCIAGFFRRAQVRRNRAALVSRNGVVVLQYSRATMLLVMLGLLALLPEITLWVYMASQMMGALPFVVMASAVLLCVLLIAFSVAGLLLTKGAPITFDGNGIQYPSEWSSVLRWTDIQRVRVTAATHGTANLVLDLHAPTTQVTRRYALVYPAATRSADGRQIYIPQGLFLAPINEVAAAWRQRIADYGRRAG